MSTRWIAVLLILLCAGWASIPVLGQSADAAESAPEQDVSIPAPAVEGAAPEVSPEQTPAETLPAESRESDLGEPEDSATPAEESAVGATSPETDAAEPAPSQPPVPEVVPEAVKDAFDVKLEGRKTWTIRYGFGSPLGLATTGVTPGQLVLDQTLTADITGEALSVLTIEAHYNDQLPDTMQSVALYLDTDRLDGVLGDFSFSALPDLAVYSKKMKGLQLEYLLGSAVLTAVISKSEGISETAVFVGQTAHATAEFTLWLDADTQAPSPYRRNLEGLYAYSLDSLYTPEFSSVQFRFTDSAALRSVLQAFEVGFLGDTATLASTLPVKAQDYRVLESEPQVFLLQRDPVLFLRQRLRELIDVYNKQYELSGGNAKSYPFIAGTDYELEFLSSVAPYSQLVVDDAAYPLLSADRRRFYDLGHADVRAASVLAEVSTDGRNFESVSSYRLPDFRITVHPEAGVLECDFPDSFYTPSSVLRVGFDYTVSEGAFMLGLSLIPGSERVMLNSEPLRLDVDYMIDYELGMLFILVPLADTDVLQVDYEVYSGGFGRTSDYASYLYGLTLELPVSDNLVIRGNLLQLADASGSAADPSRVATMPNRHTVAGVQADLGTGDFSASVLVGYNQDRFPFDDNERERRLNEINSIAAGDGYVLFGHRAGLTVDEDGNWQTYGPESGLAGQVVQAVAVGADAAYVGTEAGLTVVQLEGASPFDRTVNWMRYYAEDGLPDPSVTALLVDEATLWIGTRAGLARVAEEDIDTPEAWVSYASETDPLAPIAALAVAEDDLFVGTENGLYRLDREQDRFELVLGTEGDAVHALALAGDTLYVASERGLRGYRDGIGTGWLMLGQPVFSVLYADGRLFYGADGGLTVLVAGEASTYLAGRTVLALARGEAGIWIGGRASGEYAMDVWVFSQRLQTLAESVTGISGFDPYGYLDSVADEHTATGWVGRASFSQTQDNYTLRGGVDILPPTFRQIGSFRRADSTGWQVSGLFTLSQDADVRLEHEYRMTDQAQSFGSDRMTNRVEMIWSPKTGPTWNASIRHVRSRDEALDGDETVVESGSSFSISESYFRDALDLRMSWDRSRSESDVWGDQGQRDKLTASFDWQLTNALSTRGTWSRPIQRMQDDLRGTQQWSWDWEWGIPLGVMDIDVLYSADWAKALADAEGEWTHDGEMRFDLDPIVVTGWTFTPDVTLEATHKANDTDLHGEVVLRSDVDDFTLRSTLRGHLTNLGRPVFNREGELVLSAKYSGLANLDTSLSYTGNMSEAVKGDETAPAMSHTVAGRLVWSPESGPRDELSVSWRLKEAAGARQVTATLDNGLTIDLSAIALSLFPGEDSESADAAAGRSAADLRLDTKAEYRSGAADPEFSMSTMGQLTVAVAPKWNVTVGTSYQLGFKKVVGLYHSVLLELTFAVDF